MAIPAIPATPEPKGERGGAPSLAVLPFTNRSRDEDDEFFAEGMVEDIVAALSRGVNVRVLGSMAARNLGNGGILDSAELGQKLGVRYLLEGNIRRSSTQWRVTTQLIAARTGEVVWSERFDRPLDELAELQEELVSDVAVALDATVYRLELERALHKTGGLTAWEAIQRSNMALFESITQAQRAIDIAPDYALAHATFAGNYSVLYLVAIPDNADEISKIRFHIARALELDSGSSDVLQEVVQAFAHIGCAHEGLVHGKRAIEKAPGNAMAHFGYAKALGFVGQVELADVHFETAASLMPGAFTIWWVRLWQAIAMFRDGQWEAAESRIDQCLQLHPGEQGAMICKAVCAYRKGDDAGVALWWQRAFENGAVGPEQIQLYLSRLLAGTDTLAEFVAIFDKISESVADQIG